MIKKAIAVFVLSGFPFSAYATTYNVDPAHSSIEFAVKHLVITKVKGKFDKFNGKIEFEPGKLDTLKVTATAETASINTGVKKRDDHLRSPDFLDAGKFKTLAFVSKGVRDVNGNTAKLDSEMTIHGVSKPVTLDLEYAGAATDPWGNKVVSFSAKGKIDRKEFGLTWNKALESGGVLVGEDVELAFEIEAQEQAAKKAKK
ncbi:MAG: polyisoprenoid-binding protein [Deltaproteobacteria bacterium]|nr:polyisoprenoid-binding protein [Deltaproteobacteria bacterium]